MSATIEQWLAELGTAALVGSARRQPPPVPVSLGLAAGEGETSAEHRLLASAAVADALTRGGARLQPAGATIHLAPSENWSPAGDQATQLLHLLLHQPPVSKSVRDDLVVQWLALATLHTRRVAWRLLPALLDHASSRPAVAQALGEAIGTRGAWLISLNPAWAGLVDQATILRAQPVNEWIESWPTLPGGEAIAVFEAGRRQDASAARALLESQWEVVSAKVRGGALRCLRTGLCAADEPLLERALDDRAKTVREIAVSLLDGLPQSARGARMAVRLTGLVHVRRGLRTSLEVEVPEDPDQAGIRDGLTVAGGAGMQPRHRWLATIIRGAPLSTWTEISGRTPAQTLKMIRDQDVLNAVTATVVARQSEEWASALVANGSEDQDLIALLPAPERRARLMAHLRGQTVSREAWLALVQEPGPWDLDLGRTVLTLLARPDVDVWANALSSSLPTALPVGLAPEIAALVRTLDPGSTTRKVLAETMQIHAFRTSLTEAFS